MRNFSQFMEEWLYGLKGYYTNYKAIGKRGDFYTAVSVTPLFGGSIANYIHKLIMAKRLSGDAMIVEIGAHRGYLLADIVQFLYTFDPSLIKTLRFAIIEPQKRLQRVQRDYFYQSFGDKVELIHFDSLKDFRANEAFVVANEIFDAFSCEIVHDGKMAYEDNFSIIWGKPSEFAKKISSRYGQRRGEIAIGYEEFAKELFNGMQKGYFVSFDYGDTEVRNDISLRIYKAHQVFPFFEEGLNIKALFGKSDITYDVNFSHLIDAFKESGWQKSAYKTQMVALIDFGLMELLETILKKRGYDIYKQELEKAKHLIHPSIMGERFKMVEFIKG